MSNLIINPYAQTPPPINISFLDAQIDTSNGTVYTFSASDLGVAASDRMIIVEVQTRGSATSTTISSVTVGGVTAELVVGGTIFSETVFNGCVIFIAEVPTGATGDIVVTFANSQLRCGIGTHRMVGALSTQAYSTASATLGDPAAGNIIVPATGGAVAANMSTGTVTTAWAGLTEDFDEVIESDVSHSGAHDNFATLQASLDVEADFSSNPGSRVMCAVSFGRAEDIGGNDDDTQLLIPADGLQAATSFTDISQNGFTVTAAGNAIIDRSQSRLGGAAAFFDGVGDHISIADNAALRPGSGDFTIDFWLRFAAVKTTHTILEKGFIGAGDILIQTGAGQVISVFMGGSVAFTTPVNSINTWYHFALVRSSGTLTLYRDGVDFDNASNSTNINSTAALTFGGGVQAGFNGWLDEIRYSDVARFTTGFTPPSSPYS